MPCGFFSFFYGFFWFYTLLGERVVVVRVELLARLVPDAEVGAAALSPAVRGPRLLRHLDLLATDHLLLEGHGRRVVLGRARRVGVLLRGLGHDGRALLDLVIALLLDDGEGLLLNLGLLDLGLLDLGLLDIGLLDLGLGLLSLGLGLLGRDARADALAVALGGSAQLGSLGLPGRVHVGCVELDDLVGRRLVVAILLEAARDGKDGLLPVLLRIDALLDGLAHDLAERAPLGHGGRRLALLLLLA